MAQRTMAMGSLGLVIIAVMFAHASAQSGCTTTIITMAPCLGFITGNSSTPSSSCCSSLANVVQNNPKCLCSVLSGGASSFGITINTTKALELPAACKVKTPPVSDCNKVGTPAAAPTATPAVPTAPAPKASETPATPANPSPETPATPSTPSTPSVPSVTPAGSGSKATPSTTTTTTESSGNVKLGTTPLLFVAAFASFTVFLV